MAESVADGRVAVFLTLTMLPKKLQTLLEMQQRSDEDSVASRSSVCNEKQRSAISLTEALGKSLQTFLKASSLKK